MDAERTNRIITTYAQLIAQVILISTVGIAAGATILQKQDLNAVSVWLTLICFTFCALATISAVFGLTTLLGQATREKPDINSGWVRWPNLAGIFLFTLGIVFFVLATGVHYWKSRVGQAPQVQEQAAAPIITCGSQEPVVAVQGQDVGKRISRLNSEQKMLLGLFIERAFPDPILQKKAEEAAQGKK